MPLSSVLNNQNKCVNISNRLQTKVSIVLPHFSIYPLLPPNPIPTNLFENSQTFKSQDTKTFKSRGGKGGGVKTLSMCTCVNSP